LKPYLYLQTPTGRKKACWSEGALAPHSFEGFMFNLGNGLVKAGHVEAAKVMYANAKYADNYSTWPYRKYLEDVANSDLYARAALYADGNSLNDPPMGVPNRGCSYCHATVPDLTLLHPQDKDKNGCSRLCNSGESNGRPATRLGNALCYRHNRRTTKHWFQCVRRVPGGWSANQNLSTWTKSRLLGQDG
jgi:hypothetical protein